MILGLAAIVLGGGIAIVAPRPPTRCSDLVGTRSRYPPRRRQRRRTAQRADVTADRDLPDVITLIAAGLTAGLSVVAVTVLLAERLDSPTGVRLARAVERHRRGAPLLATLADAGLEPVVPMLRSHIEDGAVIAQGLAELAGTLRAARQREVEIAARRLPVRMLLPLTLCVLPGFLALTVAPVIIDAIRTVPR